MISYSASEAKQNFAAMLDAAARQPVVIRRHDRDVAMVISPEEYQRLHALNVERFLAHCDKMAAEAKAKGMTEEILEQLLREDD